MLEVDTPGLSRSGNTDVHIESFSVRGQSGNWFLHTSPEYPMKRLLAAGSGSIYQICRVFRDGEQGRLHNPEFSMLEWYRLDYDMQALMQDVDSLIRFVCDDEASFSETQIISYQALFQSGLGIDPLSADGNELQAVASDKGIHTANDQIMHKDDWLDLLMSSYLIPRLGEGRLVYGYPASQAALAQLDPAQPATARRFELFINGIELANGYQELRDATEQAERFQRDLDKREVLGKDSVPVDSNLLDALQHGLPVCSGVALGLDRLLLVLTGSESLTAVMAFDSTRA